MVLVEPLGEDNFDTWKIQALLIKNYLLNDVNETLLKYKDNFAQSSSEDSKAKFDLILAMSTSEIRHTKNCGTAN